jgi:hypothetical protein
MTDDVDGSTRNPPPGWLYEAPDWSVGLSGGWSHEDCPWDDLNDAEPIGVPAEVPLGRADTDKRIAGRTPYLSRLDCPCGASVVVAS